MALNFCLPYNKICFCLWRKNVSCCVMSAILFLVSYREKLTLRTVRQTPCKWCSCHPPCLTFGSALRLRQPLKSKIPVASLVECRAEWCAWCAPSRCSPRRPPIIFVVWMVGGEKERNTLSALTLSAFFSCQGGPETQKVSAFLLPGWSLGKTGSRSATC